MQFWQHFVYFTVGKTIPAVFTLADVTEHVEHSAYPIRVAGQLDDFLQCNTRKRMNIKHRKSALVF